MISLIIALASLFTIGVMHFYVHPTLRNNDERLIARIAKVMLVLGVLGMLLL